jgi:hypothetical protein
LDAHSTFLKGYKIMKKKFIINDKGKVITFKERQIRTPAEIEFMEKELPLLLMQVRFHGINDYKVEGMDDLLISKGQKRIAERESQRKYEETFLQEPSIEDFEDLEAQSLLEKLAKG